MTQDNEQKSEQKPKRNAISRHVRDGEGKLIGTLVARKQNKGGVLITYSCCHSNDTYSKKEGMNQALKKDKFVPLVNHRPAAQAKLDIIREWIPRFVEQASNFFKEEVANPL